MANLRLVELFPDLSNDDIIHLVWTMTPYPLGTYKQIIKSALSSHRALKNKRRMCECCWRDKNIGHKKGCMLDELRKQE